MIRVRENSRFMGRKWSVSCEHIREWEEESKFKKNIIRMWG